MKEATYTKYERGESQITICMVQQVAELLQVNPIRILLADPDHYIESLSQPIPQSSPETLDKLIEVLQQLMWHFSIHSRDDRDINQN
ncbi:helix-turn-helix domain-containing protein [Marinoscillum pacificum]|uniref:helix-turn-helix domain-containing protein n=1 Tax=Marinoscillum pacificum TaxID=392723 RepID=UPI0021584CE2|nr:helix-turn-helix transcriptional regulator [Marinoscillum pacificum]